MTDLTLGQRIAAQRKKLGISQEALGDKLFVSRQAISKWESDAAIPEIDKLIALSKLFGVSIGWLLGVEDTPGSKEGELSQAQWKTVEELVKKYQMPPAPRLSAFHYMFAIAASLLIFLFIFGQTSRIERLLENTVSTEKYNTLAARVSVLEDRLGLSVQSSTELTAEYTFAISSDHALAKMGKAGLRFRALPVSWEDGDAAYLAVRLGDQEVLRQECSWDSERLDCYFEIELEDGYEYALLLYHSDGTRQQQMLSNDTAQKLQTHLAITLDAWPGRFHYKNGVLTLTGYHVYAKQPESFFSGQEWTALDFVLYRNAEEEIGRDTMLDARMRPSEPILANREISISGHLVQFRDIPLEPEDTLELRLYAELSSGESKEISVQVFVPDKNGGLE